MEQEEYAVEGLNLDSIPFVDNQGCLEMIEGSFGILKMLDEEAMLPRGSDLALIEKMHKRFHDDNQNDYYDIKKIQKELFIVIHYAGPVPYLVSGFVEKNKDNVHESLTEAMKTSHVELIQIIFANAEKDITTVETCGKKRKTIASKFSHQLRSLMESLYNTSPHFVRCIKPNQAKKPGIIDAKLTLRQMKYAGLFEAIRVRASGYAYRKPLKSFFNRYKTILDKQSTAKVLKTGDFNLGCSNIINCLIDRKISLNDIQIGKTKVFYRASVFTLLENSRDGKLEARVLMMQCLTRRMLARKLLKKIKELLRLAKKSIVLNDIAKMEEVLSLSLEIPIILGIVGTVKEKLSIAKEEIRITRLIESAIETEDIDRLQGAIEQALKLNSNRREFLDFVQKANERTSQFKDVEDCKRNIQFAMDNEDLNLLMNAIAKAKELKLPQQIYNSAETALKRMEREDIIFKTLEEIMSRFSSGNADIIELERAFHPAKRITLNKLRVKLVQKAADLIVDFYNESISQKIEEKNALALKEIIDHLETSKLSSLVRNSILQASNFLRNYIGEQLPDAPADDYFTSPPPIPETYVSKKSTKEKQSSRLLNRLKKAMDLLDINKIKLYLDTYKKLGLETTPLIVLAKKIVFGMSEVEQWTLKFNRFIDDKKDVKLVRRLLKKAIEKNHPVEEDLNKARRFLVLEASHHQSHMRRISSSYVSEGQCDLTKLFHTFKGLYSFADLNILRTPENYVKKNFFHRRYLMNKMLIWQDEPILRSLIRFSLEQCNDSHVKYRQIKRRAVEMFKDVMGFMGDTHSSFSITLALDLLKTCQEEPILCDELYCQIIKQTSRNPSVESLLLGWKLMYLCLNVFNPKNADLENVIRSHIVDIANPKVQKYMPFDTVQNVASNCWLALRKSKETQYRNRPLPTIEEIRALTETKPMIMKLYLDEKEFIEFPISASRSDITVHKICELVYNHMNQKSAASGELANGLTGFTQNSGGAGPRGRRESVEEIPSLGLIGRIVIQKVNKKQSDVAILEVDPYESMVLIISTLEGQRNADPEMEYHFQYLKESRPILGQSSIVDITDDEEQDDDEDDDEVEDPHIQITRHSSRVTSPIWEDPFLME